MSQIMWRETNRTKRLEGRVVVIPVPVKHFRRVWCPSFRQEERRVRSNVDESVPTFWIMERPHLLKIRVERLLNARVMGKVDRFDFTPITAFVHDLRLASNPLVLVAAHRHEGHFVNPGSS